MNWALHDLASEFESAISEKTALQSRRRFGAITDWQKLKHYIFEFTVVISTSSAGVIIWARFLKVVMCYASTRVRRRSRDYLHLFEGICMKNGRRTRRASSIAFVAIYLTLSFSGCSNGQEQAACPGRGVTTLQLSYTSAFTSGQQNPPIMFTASGQMANVTLLKRRRAGK